MKITTITTANSKGQIVIPKPIRKSLGIDESVPLQVVQRGNGIYIYPVAGPVGGADRKEMYLKILEQTRGGWGPTTKEELARERTQHELERKASIRRKQAW